MDADGDVEAVESDEPSRIWRCRVTIETERLRAAIEELPAEFREAVVLKDLQGLSYREIAQRSWRFRSER